MNVEIFISNAKNKVPVGTILKNLGNGISTIVKQSKPAIYDSSQQGHSCHCTLFLMYLKEMGLVKGINGKGVTGNTFQSQL